MANVLVLDDEPTVLDLICKILRLDGHSVRAMSDPVAVLDFISQAGAGIDLFLTDIATKPLSGFELVDLLIGAGFHAPVIFMSGYSALAEAVGASLEVRELLEKPFTAAKLRAAVGTALDRSTAQRPSIACRAADGNTRC